MADWTRDECEELIGAYARLLTAHDHGTPLVKREVVRELQAQLPGRTRGSIEYKLQNVSAVLSETGQNWLPGYPPAMNYQRLLGELVRQNLGRPRTG